MMNIRQPIAGGLQLPQTLGVGESVEKEVHKNWSTLNYVEGKLAMEGFTPMGTPGFECPQVTEEALTTADNKAYTEQYARQLAWFNYSAQMLAHAKAERLQVDNESTLIEVRMRKMLKEKMRLGGKEAKMTAEEIKDEIFSNPRMVELRHQGQVLEQYVLQLSAYTEGMERNMRVLSRQIEIRKLEIESSRINIPNRGYGMR